MSKNDNSSYIDLCSTCTQNCCETVDCAPVFPSDLKKLASIKKNTSKYIKNLKLADGKHLMQIKKKPNSNQCIFFDGEKKQCMIYENRPLDCRMYPFDIEVINGEPWWIVYSCNKNSDWKWTENHLQKFEAEPEFHELMENVVLYDLYVIQGHDYRGIQEIPLRKVNWNNTPKIKNPKIVTRATQ